MHQKTQRAIKQLYALQEHGKTMRLAAEAWDNPWQVLTATILSARTRDEVTIIVAHALFMKYPTARDLARAPITTIARIIKPVNFYKTKAKNIHGCARNLTLHYNGNPPRNVTHLLTLPGVGRKTANVFLSEMGHDTIGVDTHVGYLAKKLGWTKHNDPKKIEHDLQRLFPRTYWKELNPILVRFGKTYTSKKKKDALVTKVNYSALKG